jgi:hypothetical protein
MMFYHILARDLTMCLTVVFSAPSLLIRNINRSNRTLNQHGINHIIKVICWYAKRITTYSATQHHQRTHHHISGMARCAVLSLPDV